ncbi:MAG: hypothetical protein ABIQ70_05295 [Dokdonella sp.]
MLDLSAAIFCFNQFNNGDGSVVIADQNRFSTVSVTVVLALEALMGDGESRNRGESIVFSIA